MFKLIDPTNAELTALNTRQEHHGDEKVPAASFHFAVRTANTILDHLSNSLRDTLYTAAPGQKRIEGVEATTPHLRSSEIESVAISASFEGWTLEVEHGIDEHVPIAFGGCKVDKFRVMPSDGGTVDLRFRVGTSDVDAERLGVMAMKLGATVALRLLPPNKPTDKPTDKGAPLLEDQDTPEKALQRAARGKKAAR